jgi:hypothetical protein
LATPTPLQQPDHQEALTWLHDHPQALTGLIADAGAHRGWWQAQRAWVRRSARFNPAAAAYCTFLFESESTGAGADHAAQVFCVADVCAAPQTATGDAEACVAVAPLGYVKLTRFPQDAALLTLPRVLQQAAHVQICRYRPQRRCTLRALDAEGAAVYAKVFPDQRGAGIHDTGVALWQAAGRGELTFQVAPPRRWDNELRCLWQGEAPGAPVLPLLQGEQGPAQAHALGRALASLARAALPCGGTYDAAWQLRRTARAAATLTARAPQHAASVEALMAQFDHAHAQLAPHALRPIHGAPHPQQWLAFDGGCSLVDFDRSGAGDSELDVATFVAEVDFENPRRYDIARINAEFVRGFESVAGALDPLRLGLYRTHKHVAKALRAARSVRPDGVARAVAHVERLRADFDRLCEGKIGG